jgi:hypothetical protein
VLASTNQLLIDNDIKAVIPDEDAAAYRAATPVQDGQVVFNEKANEARADAIIGNTLRASGTAVLVLGGAHDLSDNVPAGVRLIVLTVKGYPGE